MRITYSMSEVAALSKCAARGAGHSWGMADEIAEATVWLAARALPGPSMLARLLQINESVPFENLAPVSLSGAWTGSTESLCPLLTGIALSDCAQLLRRQQVISLSSVMFPLYLLPFAATAALEIKSAIAVEWHGVVTATDGCSLYLQGDRSAMTTEAASNVCCTIRDGYHGSSPAENRVNIDPDCLSLLRRFAQRTYAPATEDSRLRGAGAAMNDND